MEHLAEEVGQFIKDNASSTVQSRGKSVFNTPGGIINANIDYHKSLASFLVQGTFNYRVQIQGFKRPIITSCSCPYNWGGLCKHEVAALLFLQEELMQKTEDEPVAIMNELAKKNYSNRPVITPRRRASTPYLIPDYLPLTVNQILSHTDLNALNRFSGLEKMRFHYENGKLTISAQEMVYWRYAERNKTFKISCEDENDELKVSCSCDKKVVGICVHAAFVLQEIAKEKGRDFLAFLKPDFVEKKYLQKVEETGISREEIENYFVYNAPKERFDKTLKAKGLLLFNEDSGETSSPVLQIINKKKDGWLHALKNNEKSQNIGFVLNVRSYDFLNIIPITGTITDDHWLKYIKNYSYSNTPLYLNQSDKEALARTEEVNNWLEYLETNYLDVSEGSDYKKTSFDKVNELLLTLADKRYIYIIDNQYQGAAYGFNENKNVKKSDLKPVEVASSPLELFFELVEDDIFFELKIGLKDDTEVVLSPEEIDSIGINEVFVSTYAINNRNTLHPHISLSQAELLGQLLATDSGLKCLKKEFTAFFQTVLQPLGRQYQIAYNESIVDFKVEEVELTPIARELYISEADQFIVFRPVVKYDHQQSIGLQETGILQQKKDETILMYLRNEEYEHQYFQLFKDLHPSFVGQESEDFFYLPFHEVLKDNWFFDVFDFLNKKHIDVFGIDQLKQLKYSPFKASINTHISSGEDWFDVTVELSFGDEKISLAQLKKAILRKDRYIQLSNGKYGILPEEWFEKFQQYFRSAVVEDGQLKISKMKFSIVDSLFENIDDAEVLEELANRKERLQTFTAIDKVSLPKGVNAELRDYQKEGLNWLNFLDEFKWGGILADDMGLGKTIQVLTFLKGQIDKNSTTNLAVLPTSLLFNWEKEIKKFIPMVKYHIHHGINRLKSVKDFEDYDLILTTYGVVTNDIEMMQSYTFNYIVLDESQAIKNPSSKRYKACCLLKAKNKIAMTGTPIENNTFDLYAQMNFLNPAFLGSQKRFKDDFSKPIDVAKDENRSQELHKLIRPFVLRRTKEQVAKELPPKIEDYIYCTMGTEQRELYNAYRNKYRNHLMKKIEEDGLEQNKFFVLEGLLKLRQICDSPALLKDNDNYTDESVKIKELVAQVREKTGNHKILIFSQFVQMLQLIRKQLEAHDISYEYLDGKCSIKDREKSVDNFQTNNNCRVFLISLKAGGTGLNLTAADYVYLVDPWWNPAVENQAIDRTHRIGQDKHIIAYRMICKDTVEEKIMKLQARKMKIASDIIQVEESFLKNLTKDDIAELFE